MNNYKTLDNEFINTKSYLDFIKNNPSRGSLKIRAYAASQAIPVKNVKVVVSTIIDDQNVIFFEGYTDESGIIEKISLPAPKSISNLEKPNKTTYDVNVSYQQDNINKTYRVNMYENICVIQNVDVVPDIGGI